VPKQPAEAGEWRSFLAADLAHQPHEDVALLQHPPGAREHLRAGVGQSDAAPTSVEQCSTGEGLEIGDPLGNGRPAYPKARCGCDEASFSGARDQGFELCEVGSAHGERGKPAIAVWWG
jgi:hypothetical protein